MENSIPNTKPDSWLDKPLFSGLPKIKLEHLLVTLIILMTVISRFYNVGARVMSHDEVNHVVPAYDLYMGRGYSHDPVTHGPMQFHLLAASYFFFGDSDFSARIPAVLFSIATIVFVLFAWRRYLGRSGALFAGLFFLVSPYFLFYGRYTRNEAFIGLFGVVLLYAVLRYLDKGKISTLYLYSAVLALYFCSKETSFIFTAEMLIFMAFVFLKDITQKEWKKPANKDVFILVMMITLLLVGIALGAGVINARTVAESAPAITSGENTGITTPEPSLANIIMLVSLGLAGASLIIAIIFLLLGLGWENIKSIRSFDILLLTMTMVMPLLIAFPIKWFGWNPLDYSQPALIKTSVVLLVVVVLAASIGLLWKPIPWLKNMVIFYAIFTVFYTTVFTNGQGFFTGMVGSLGYWLSQQSVNRGSQPWYYYALVQIPMYEYLAAFGTLLAFILALRYKLFSLIPQISPTTQIEQVIAARKAARLRNELIVEGLEIEKAGGPPFKLPPELVPDTTEPEPATDADGNPKRVPVLALLIFWALMSLIAYSVAGEKMPQMTLHIALPMLLATGLGVGYLVDSMTTQKWNHKSILALLLFPIFLIGVSKVLGMLIGPDKPFMGMELFQLQLTSTFLFSLIAAVLSGWGIYKLMEGWNTRLIFKTFVITFFGVLTILTARSAYQASYINYDTGKEFLVYAHSARGPKDVLAQVNELSKSTTGGKDIKVAYIGDALYPYWWYFRDYPNKTWIKDKLTRDLDQYPVVISDDVEIEKARAILDNNYYEFKYKRLIWPMQNYMNQTIKTVWTALKDPQIVKAVFQIWLNKDYSLYASIKGINSLTLENWEPSGNIYLFIKKDMAASIWTYGTMPSALQPAEVDPYDALMVELTPDLFFGTPGSEEGQFNGAHDLAIGPNGDIYVTDARNHRIQRYSADGVYKSSWGTFATVDNGEAPGGTFNEPWGIAVGPDGSVYVTDTWNYRIQKFTAEGKFVTMWGKAGTADSPTSFWGPRGIVVDKNGNVFVTDTGNNRVVIFDSNGRYLNQFGVVGIGSGEFDEPVGLAVDNQGLLYVVDTWNQRIQVFQSIDSDLVYRPLREWQVSGWKSQSVNNKPFIDVDGNGHVFVTDPDGYRILEFNNLGEFVRGWGDYSSGIDGFGMPIGIAVDEEGRVWVSDAENGYILRFTLPELISTQASSLPVGLPALPISNSNLIYNPTTGFVDNPFGQPVYRLDVNGTQWVPIIPEGIASLLPLGTVQFQSESGEWQLLQADGSIAFRWQPDVLLWLAEIPANATPQ